jgi:hypothetical protein
VLSLGERRQVNAPGIDFLQRLRGALAPGPERSQTKCVALLSDSDR